RSLRNGTLEHDRVVRQREDSGAFAFAPDPSNRSRLDDGLSGLERDHDRRSRAKVLGKNLAPDSSPVAGVESGLPFEVEAERFPVELLPAFPDVGEIRRGDPELLKRESGPAPSVGERELGDRVVAFWPVFGPPSEHEPLTPLGDDHDPAQRIVVERERTPDLRGDL